MTNCYKKACAMINMAKENLVNLIAKRTAIVSLKCQEGNNAS